ncbi:MAG: type II toxin-antitoxin system Phd/YefM family antitoxin [Chloroflexi bacterium]|nr:type II toxin-antitoxin system Phd/YefM family antitoxin [Chloroflexota bacterium]
MKTVGIRDLKDNPSRAVRAAREHAVLITSRDDPEALLLSLRNLGEHEADARITIAATLYDEAGMSLGRAARLAGTDVAAFIEYLASRGIPIFRGARDELERDLRALGG